MVTQQTKTALSLEGIVQYELPPTPVHIQPWLNRDAIIGLIGDRGDGKSLGAGVIALFDHMVEGETCWANMRIGASFSVDASTLAQPKYAKYNLKPGEARFSSKPLDMAKLLAFDPEYSGGVAVVDEINVAVADARRAMANQNLGFDDVGQQLRKSKMALIYTCIHEMFVDVRIRDITDVFIQSIDTALTPEGLERHQHSGMEFKWTIYPMSRKLTGVRYSESHQTLGPVYIRGRRLWGLVDTWKRQTRTRYKMSVPGAVAGAPEATLDIEQSPQMVEAQSRWGWLYDKIQSLHAQGIPEIEDDVLWEYLQLKERGLTPQRVGQQLSAMGIQTGAGRHAHRNYYIDTFDLTRQSKEKKQYVLAEI